MSDTCKKVVIDGKEYKLVAAETMPALLRDGMKYCLIRTCSAGVFCGYIAERNGKEATVVDAIRLWKWSGAASLSQLAMEGVKSPRECKFGVPITTELLLTEVIEIIEMTEAAKLNIQSVPSWRI